MFQGLIGRYLSILNNCEFIDKSGPVSIYTILTHLNGGGEGHEAIHLSNPHKQLLVNHSLLMTGLLMVCPI